MRRLGPSNVARNIRANRLHVNILTIADEWHICNDIMELVLTIFALVAGVALVTYASWMERRPRTSMSPPLIPSTPLMFAGAIIAILAVAHLLTLNGITIPQRGL